MSEAEISQALYRKVADVAPRLFAIVHEDDETEDAKIAAWGMSFEDGAEIVSVDGGPRMSLRSVERALQLFSWAGNPRVVWVA